MHVIKIDIEQRTATCLNPCSNILFYYFFCRSNNKNLFEVFLLTINKEYILAISRNLLGRNHPTLFVFDLEEIPNNYWAFSNNYNDYKLYDWKYRSSHSNMFFKIGALKNLAIFIRKHLCWSLFLIKLQTSNPVTLLKSNSSTGVCERRLLKFNKSVFWLIMK